MVVLCVRYSSSMTRPETTAASSRDVTIINGDVFHRKLAISKTPTDDIPWYSEGCLGKDHERISTRENRIRDSDHGFYSRRQG